MTRVVRTSNFSVHALHTSRTNLLLDRTCSLLLFNVVFLFMHFIPDEGLKLTWWIRPKRWPAKKTRTARPQRLSGIQSTVHPQPWHNAVWGRCVVGPGACVVAHVRLLSGPGVLCGCALSGAIAQYAVDGRHTGYGGSCANACRVLKQK